MNLGHIARSGWLWLALCLPSLGAGLGLVGCDDTEDSPNRLVPPGEIGPIALGDRLAYINAFDDQVHLLDLSDDPPAPEAQSVRLPSVPRLWSKRADRDEVLLLCDGRKDPDDDKEPVPALVVLGAGGKLRTYEVGHSFAQLEQSRDGRWAILYGGAGASGSLVSNPNQVALVDLSAEPGADNPRLHTLLGLGGAPSSARITPEVEILGERRRLAVLFSSSYVSIFDLAHPERSEITVPFGEVESAEPASPQQIEFDESRSALFVRTSNGNDVYMVVFAEDVDDQSEHDFVLAPPNPLSVGGRASDIILYKETDGQTRLLAVLPTSLSIVEPNSARLTQVNLGAEHNRMLAYRLQDDDGDGPPRLFLYGVDSGSQQLTFVELSDLEARRSRNVEGLTLPSSAYLRGEAILHKERAILRNEEVGLTVVDLRQRSASPLSISYEAQRQVLDREQDRLWVLGATRAAAVSLQDLSVKELRLDAPIAYMVVPTDSSFLVFDHDYEEGYLTLVDREEPQRSTAQSLRGFLWQGLFSRGELR